MNPHPELIQQFCTQAIENGTLGAAVTRARMDLFLEWEDSEDAMRRDQIWHTLRALMKVVGIMEGYSMNAPEVD